MDRERRRWEGNCPPPSTARTTGTQAEGDRRECSQMTSSRSAFGFAADFYVKRTASLSTATAEAATATALTEGTQVHDADEEPSRALRVADDLALRDLVRPLDLRAHISMPLKDVLRLKKLNRRHN